MPAADDAADESPLDDDHIENDDELYRRLANNGPDMVAVDLETGERRPSSGAFKPDHDGVSVFRRDLLTDAGLDVDDVVKDPWNLVVSVGVGDVRSINLGVHDDPWPQDIDDPGHPRNGAHALITGIESLSRNQQRKLQKRLVELPSVTFLRG